MGPARTILFLCPHNAAKSLLAAADFDRMAAGTRTRTGPTRRGPIRLPNRLRPSWRCLRDEGIDIAGYRPRFVTGED